MKRVELVEQIRRKQNYLCVGLDTDITKLPKAFASRPNAVSEFNKVIIDATKDFCVSYKINTAFYEAMGIDGWRALQQTVDYIPYTHLKIADAKRGDIGNTSAQYAKTFFEVYGFDAVTVAPYMGEDSLRPFLEYEEKWTIVLGLTSNKGSNDFQQLVVNGRVQEERLYDAVMHKVSEWGTIDNLMFVVGATKAEQMEQIRQRYPSHFFLVPGIGAQGGSLEEVSNAALTLDAGLLVNASRAILYASSGEDFAEAAYNVTLQYAEEMKQLLSGKI
jgi:orotidine-5'-phosphate decarboxylase